MNVFASFFVVVMASYVTCKPTIVRQEEVLLTGMERISKRSPLIEEYSPEETLSAAKEPRFKRDPAASTAFFRPRFTRSKREINDDDDLETAESNVFMPLFFFRRQNLNKERYFRRRFY